MTRLWDSAAGLLLCTGALLGLTPLFGKIAAQGGVPAPAWAFTVSAGAAAVLWGALLARRCSRCSSGCRRSAGRST